MYRFSLKLLNNKREWISSVENMWISLLTLIYVTTVWAMSHAQPMLSYYIVPDNTTICISKSSMYDACSTLQQFAKQVYLNSSFFFYSNITIEFAVGKHRLKGGIEFNQTVNVVLKGLEAQDKPEISCELKSCFSFHNSSNIHIENLVFTDCISEDSDGGAVYVREAEDIKIIQCLFANNFIRKRGGAMRLQQVTNVNIFNSRFINNSAICFPSDIRPLLGSFVCSQRCVASSGAISAYNISKILIEDSFFESNRASCFSGAVLLLETSSTIVNSSFIKNNAQGLLGFGGGLYIDSSTTRVSNCTFEQNSAGVGGGIYTSSSTLTVLKGSFVSNTAGLALSGGGAAHIASSSLLIDESVFEKNVGNFGGAIKIEASSHNAVIMKSTFQKNANQNGFSGSGGAIHLQLTGEPNCTSSCNQKVTPRGTEPIVSIVDCAFISNKGRIQGGAIDITRGVLNISKSDFINNVAPIGGAIVLRSSFAFFQMNNFIENKAITFGGSVHLESGIIFSDNNTFMNNSGKSGGGAINVIYSTLISFNDCYSKNAGIINGGALSALRSTVACSDCIFYKNNVLGNGGAVFVSKGTFNSLKSTYEANFASLSGGALFLVRSAGRIAEDYYTQNSADKGAAVFQTDNRIQLYNTTFDGNKAIKTDQVHTVQLTNVQGTCSGLTFTKCVGSLYLLNSKLTFSGLISFIDNTGVAGGALTLVQGVLYIADFAEVNITGNSATYGGGIFLSQSELKVCTPNFIVHNNTASNSGGGIYSYQSQVNININRTSEIVQLYSNSAAKEGGGLNAIASSLNIFHGFILFSSNEAMKGGAVALSEGSKIYVQKVEEENLNFNEPGINLRLSNNSADYGGALYVANTSNTGVLCKQSTRDHTQSVSSEECFLQILRLYYPQRFTYGQFNYMNIFFSFNTGMKAGSDIYGGLLDRCQVNAFAEINNFVSVRRNLSGFDYLKTIARFEIGIDYSKITTPFNPRNVANSITRDSVRGLVSSDPVQLCFCYNNTYDCSYEWPRIFTRKGEAFLLEAVIVDQVENPVNGTVLANVISDGTQLKVDQSRKKTKGVCTDLIYNLYSDETNVTFQLYPEGPCDDKGISSKTLRVTFLPCNCPNGLQPAPIDNECRCECGSVVSVYASSCQQQNSSITVVRRTRDYWFQYVLDENVTGFLLKSCPFDYCMDMPVNLSICIPQDANKQCAFNRSGTMCGECKEGLSLVFGSSRCLQCSNNYLALLAVFTFAGVALVAFIFIFNLTVAVGTIHGLILYANIVAANGNVFLPSDTALRFFVSWVNLDLGIETCFYDGMDSYAKVLLQLAFPTYIILLSVLIIIVSNYWGWFAKLIGGRKNPIATLCTLFLLSYSKLLRTTIASLQFTYLTYPDGSSKILWLYNPNVLHFSPSRTPFFISSIVIIVLGAVYTVLLFFGQWIRKIEAKKISRCFQSVKYNAFLDAYHGPFITKYRYWIGILLLTRIIHHVLSSVLDDLTHLLIVSSLICALLILKQILTEVYQKWFIGFVETSYLINLLLFSVSTYYASTTNGDQVAVANTSVAIAFITFIGIVMYHAHTYLFKSLNSYMKVISAIQNVQCLSKFKQKKTKTNTLVANNDEVAAADQDTSMHLSLLREPALDIIAPVSNNDYSPPAVVPASDSIKPLVSSTTVEIKKVNFQ